MKCETTNTVLTFVLGALALLGVIFALQTIFRTRELHTLTVRAAMANNNLMKVQALGSEAYAYNQKHPDPELTKLLQSMQAKPAAR